MDLSTQFWHKNVVKNRDFNEHQRLWISADDWGVAGSDEMDYLEIMGSNQHLLVSFLQNFRAVILIA